MTNIHIAQHNDLAIWGSEGKYKYCMPKAQYESDMNVILQTFRLTLIRE